MRLNDGLHICLAMRGGDEAEVDPRDEDTVVAGKVENHAALRSLDLRLAEVV